MSAKGNDHMANELKLGGTYKHYKTHGLYVALQLVKFEPYVVGVSHLLSEVTFTGDGPLENRVGSLYICFAPSVRLYIDDTNFEGLRGKHHVLYWSQHLQRYFVRPLAEFTADVLQEGKPVARFALQR